MTSSTGMTSFERVQTWTIGVRFSVMACPQLNPGSDRAVRVGLGSGGNARSSGVMTPPSRFVS
jgi:hypothetical protein